MPGKLVPATVRCVDTCGQRGAHLIIDQASRQLQLQLICNIKVVRAGSSCHLQRGTDASGTTEVFLGTGDNTCSMQPRRAFTVGMEYVTHPSGYIPV